MFLKNFYEQVKGKTSAEIASALENAQDFKEQHAAAAEEGETQITSQTLHHFIAYVVNKRGQLLELDGTKKGPVVIAENCADVLTGAVTEIKRRLDDKEISESISMMSVNAKGEM